MKEIHPVSYARNGEAGEGTEYVYDADGNKIKECYAQEAVEKEETPQKWHTITFSYDKNNHLVCVKDEFGAKICYDYDWLENVIFEEKVI